MTTSTGDGRALAAGITTVSTYLPVVANQFTESKTAIGSRADGYPAAWGVAGLATLASLPFLRAADRRAR